MRRLYILFVLFVTLLVAASGCRSEQPPASLETTYSIGTLATVRALYPDNSWLPDAYKSQQYGDLGATIKTFTEQSLRRDGLDGATVKVLVAGENDPVIVVIDQVNEITELYRKVHPAFLDAKHAGQALLGVQACKETKDCWDPEKSKTAPWAPFLPLGLPMAAQKTVLFLDYPPVPAIEGMDYLNNFTMCRWARVLGAAGADNPEAYETIVDARPIVAAGSNEAAQLPDALKYFANSAGAGDYLAPMLELLSNPGGGDKALPVAIMGRQARTTWGNLVKAKDIPVGILEADASVLGDSGLLVPWIGCNHPDVTSYGCCKEDAGCAAGDQDLMENEAKDFVVACWLMAMAQADPKDPKVVLGECEDRWVNKVRPEDALTLCIQEKLDDNIIPSRCKTWAGAWAFCSAQNSYACTQVDTGCGPYDANPGTDVPPEELRPKGWDNTCNEFRPSLATRPE